MTTCMVLSIDTLKIRCNIRYYLHISCFFKASIQIYSCMIDDKIRHYKEQISTARKLKNIYETNREHYERLIERFSKLLTFYENLKVYKDFHRELKN